MVAPPPPWTPASYEPPIPPFTRSVGYCSASCTSSCTARSSAIAAGAGRRGPRRGGVPVSWVTRPGTGRTAPLPSDWLPSKAQGGKFLIAGFVSAGSCHWHLIFERWADHGLGEVRATPRQDTVLFRANWTRILRDGVYVVEDEGKYHGFVVGQALSRPGALRVKCEDNTQRHQQSAVRAVLAERERKPTSQLRQALAAFKENLDTRVRVCPPASMSTWPLGPQNAHGWRAGALFWQRSKQLVLATFQSVTKKRLKNLLNVAGKAYWNVAGTLILAILHVGGGHPYQPVGPARRSDDPSLARKRSRAHLFGYVASAVPPAARRRTRVPHGHDGLRGSPRQRSRDVHRRVGQHWRPVPSAAALPTSGRRAPPPARVRTARATPTPEPPPSPPNSTQTQTQTPTPPQAGTQERPQTPPQKRKRLPGESSSEESSVDSLTDSSSGSTTDSPAFEEPQPRPPAKEPTKPPRKAPKRAAPPQPKSKAKPKARRGRGANTKRGSKCM